MSTVILTWFLPIVLGPSDRLRSVSFPIAPTTVSYSTLIGLFLFLPDVYRLGWTVDVVGLRCSLSIDLICFLRRFNPSFVSFGLPFYVFFSSSLLSLYLFGFTEILDTPLRVGEIIGLFSFNIVPWWRMGSLTVLSSFYRLRFFVLRHSRGKNDHAYIWPLW